MVIHWKACFAICTQRRGGSGRKQTCDNIKKQNDCEISWAYPPEGVKLIWSQRKEVHRILAPPHHKEDVDPSSTTYSCVGQTDKCWTLVMKVQAPYEEIPFFSHPILCPPTALTAGLLSSCFLSSGPQRSLRSHGLQGLQDRNHEWRECRNRESPIVANQTGLELQQLCVIYSGQSRLLEKLKCRCPLFEPRVYILLCVHWLTNTDMIHILFFFFPAASIG